LEDIDEKFILKWILTKVAWEDVDWIQVLQGSAQWWALDMLRISGVS
jgi:hypothetical protein